MISAQNTFNEAQRRVASTPQTIQSPVYETYTYQTAVISGSKSVDWIVYVGKPASGAYETYAKRLESSKKFNVAYKIDNRDERANHLASEYDKEADAERWEKENLEVSLDTILAEGPKSAIPLEWPKVVATLVRWQDGVALTALKTSVKGPQEGAIDKTDKRLTSVVVIRTADALGSGFFVTPDMIITNAHVIKGQHYIAMKTVDGASINGKVLAEDRRRDLALVKVEGAPVTLSTREISIGNAVEVVGHPQGLQYSLTRGIVSQVRALAPVSGIGGGLVSYIQLDASISPGNSGGPVYQNGEVIGVATWKVSAKDTENLNFAIHRDELFSFLRENGISP
jgi:serine protease Do